MHQVATRKLNQTGAEFELRLGDDTDLTWPDNRFDHAVALHSFQFWSNPEPTVRPLSALLKNDGHLWLCLRSHGSKPPEWLPNPVSRSGEEIAKTVHLLNESGFEGAERVPTVQKIDLISARKRSSARSGSADNPSPTNPC